MSLKISNNKQPKQTKIVALWLVYPLALIVWWVLPWAISLLTHHFGWIAGHPDIWNLLGLIPVLIGTCGLLWGVYVHSAQSPQGMEWELDKSYLLKGSLYKFSRNPMYVSELTTLFGWVIFYGSISVMILFAAWYVFFEYYAVPQEERVLETHFGDAYQEYRNRVPRWFGKVRH